MKHIPDREIVFCSHCLSWLRTSFAQTEKSCIAKWNLYGGFLRTNFGEDAVAEGEQILLNLFEQRKRMEATNPYAFQNTIRECGAQIAANMSYEERLQLLSFLAQIARSDGNVCAAEIDALKEVAQSMQLSAKEVESMLNLSGNSLEEAYKVLEVEPTATDDEVRAAFDALR